jgi:hypothetical protein
VADLGVFANIDEVIGWNRPNIQNEHPTAEDIDWARNSLVPSEYQEDLIRRLYEVTVDRAGQYNNTLYNAMAQQGQQSMNQMSWLEQRYAQQAQVQYQLMCCCSALPLEQYFSSALNQAQARQMSWLEQQTAQDIWQYFDNPYSHAAQSDRITEPKRRKRLKAECKAQQLLQLLLGMDEWKYYRKTNLVAVKGKWIWLIGDVFKNYDKFSPFQGKPDVIRVDEQTSNPFKRVIKSGKAKEGVIGTSFCVDCKDRDQPYSDKVAAFMVQCAYDEDGFYKMANRLREVTIKPPRCALYEPS